MTRLDWTYEFNYLINATLHKMGNSTTVQHLIFPDVCILKDEQKYLNMFRTTIS